MKNSGECRARRSAAEAAKPGLGLVFWISFGWVALMILLAIVASILPLKQPNFQDYTAVNVGPSLHHLLGTDDLGPGPPGPDHLRLPRLSSSSASPRSVSPSSSGAASV